jgi:TrpR-related protein YerC/YecD
MAKFSNPSKLPEKERENLMADFCLALSRLNSVAEVSQFLKDLLSAQEMEMLAKRLKAADLLLGGWTYAKISQELKISSGTISRIHEWLKVSGEGYRLVAEKLSQDRKNNKKIENFSWQGMKKKYPLYFWPQLLIEDIVKKAKYKDQQRWQMMIKKMDQKTELYKRLNSLLVPKIGEKNKRRKA